MKSIMRLCHPDKCALVKTLMSSWRAFVQGKHPEAKRAMQILSPLL